MKIVRSPEYLIEIEAHLQDEHLWAAITPPRRWVESEQRCTGGTVYRVIGYTIPIPGAKRPITGEDLYGNPIKEFMLEVQYLVLDDKPDEAHIMYAFEADERGFWEYGGTEEA